jgi:hypothetical protein
VLSLGHLGQEQYRAVRETELPITLTSGKRRLDISMRVQQFMPLGFNVTLNVRNGTVELVRSWESREGNLRHYKTAVSRVLVNGVAVSVVGVMLGRRTGMVRRSVAVNAIPFRA